MAAPPRTPTRFTAAERLAINKFVAFFDDDYTRLADPSKLLDKDSLKIIKGLDGVIRARAGWSEAGDSLMPMAPAPASQFVIWSLDGKAVYATNNRDLLGFDLAYVTTYGD